MALLNVALNACDIEDTSKPWLACARMREDREFAVLCATCAPLAVAEGARRQAKPEAREVAEQAPVGWA